MTTHHAKAAAKAFPRRSLARLGSVAALALACSAASAQFLSTTTMQPQVVYAAKSAMPAPTNRMQANPLCIPPAGGGDTCGIVRYKGISIVPYLPILGQATGSMPVWKGNSIVWVGYDRNNTPTGLEEVPLAAGAYSIDRLPNLNPIVRNNAGSILNSDIAERFVPQVIPPEAIPAFKISSLTGVPPELKACSFTGQSADSGVCPSLSFYGATLVPFSYKDNRMASSLVGFDRASNIMYSFALPGIRYISAVSVDAKAQTVTFTGQNNVTVVMSFFDLPFNAPLPR